MFLKNWRLTPEQRYQKRMKRMERWQKPLVTRRDRLQAWLHMVFVDHGFIRYIYLNEHEVSPHLRRSAQPAPLHIRRWAKAGIKTIINLRGGYDHGGWPLEKGVCDHYGIRLEELVLRSREAPSKALISEAQALFARIEGPAILHCKSGADRAGLGSALWLILKEKKPVSEARRQLSWRFGHLRHAKTGILDAFFDAYEQANNQGSIDFMDWVEHHYDPVSLQQSFRAGWLGSLFGDAILKRE
jgi:protein tyrosine phosphatase (PTP) superfamily phosphohydrolase (DUF442 family)